MSSREFNQINQVQKAIICRHLKVKPVPLGAMAKELGISVKLSAMNPGVSGSIQNIEGDYFIKINRYETRERQRFTLAHEIAHYLLHRDIVDAVGGIEDNVLYRSGQPANIEYEANRLAADLVMPDTPVNLDLNKALTSVTDEYIERLAREWQVSKAAMEIKLSNVAA